MDHIEGFELSEKIKQAFQGPCYSMIEQGVMPRAIAMGLIIQAFDIFLDEAADHSDTRKVFLAMCDAATRYRLDSLEIPNIHDE